MEATAQHQPSKIQRLKWWFEYKTYPIRSRFTETNAEKMAKREFEIIRQMNSDPDKQHIACQYEKEILKLLRAFGRSGQSGGSAPYTAQAILCRC